MTAEVVVAILQTKGSYRVAPGSLRIFDAELGADFDAVLVGPGSEGCLVLVLDAGVKSPQIVHRRVRSLTMILDRSGSKRPFSLVLISPPPEMELMLQLEQLCRIVVVSPESVDVEEALSTLLPLNLPSPERTLNSADRALSTALGQGGKTKFVNDLLRAAKISGEEVQKVLLSAIELAAREDQVDEDKP